MFAGICMLMNIKYLLVYGDYIYLSFCMFVWYVVWEWVGYEFVFEMLRCVFVFLVVVVVVDDDDVS